MGAETVAVSGADLRHPAFVQTIPAALLYWAERTPHAPALRALDGREWPFRELLAAVSNAAHRLLAMGLAPNAPAALILPSGAEACLALLAASVAGIAAPLNPGATRHELARDLRRLRPRLAVVGGPRAALVHEIAVALNIPTVGVDALLAPHGSFTSAPAGLPFRDPESIAVLLHTSGTTAEPKRVPRPHRTYVAAARAAAMCTDLMPEDVGLLVNRLHTNGGVGNLLASLFTGGCCVATPGLDPMAMPGWLAAHQPTWFVSMPAELALLLDAMEALPAESVAASSSRLRAVRLGAQPMLPGLIERAERLLRAPVCDGFGMTEASYITGQGPDPRGRREGSVGPPLNSEIRILDERGRGQPPEVTGEIVIRGETLFPGYLDDAEANAAAFLPDGWFRTGDLGYLDDAGHLYLIGRAHEQINRGGEKIAPLEIDRALLTHPAVAEAAVFAVPHARLGEDLIAAVALKAGHSASPRELREWLLGRLMPHKVPRRIWRIDALPRTSTGKVQRAVLARRWREEHP